MKHLILLVLVASCANKRAQEIVPPFNKEKVCSSVGLEYLEKTKKVKSGPKTDPEYVRLKMLNLHTMAKNCYNADLDRGELHHHFNLCFIAGFDANGSQEYVNFHTNEVELSSKFYDCLYDGVKKADLSGLKDITVIQPFKFRPIY